VNDGTDDGAKAPPPGATHLVLYDGVCGFCNGVVRFVLKRDRKGVFVFAPLQAEKSVELLERWGRDASDLDTIYVIEDYGGDAPTLRERSDGALFIARHLTWPWRWLAPLRVVPAFLRDPVYRLVAAVRYRIWGKKDSCPLPPPEWRERFLWD